MITTGLWGIRGKMVGIQPRTLRCISILFLIGASGGAALSQPIEDIKSEAGDRSESNQSASTINLDPKIKTWLGNFNDPAAASEILAQPFLTALLSDYFEIIGEPTAFQRAINNREPICLTACREFGAEKIIIGDKATSSDFVRMLMNTRYGHVEEASQRWSALARIDQILGEVGVEHIRLTNEDAEYFAVEFAKIVKASNTLSGMDYPHIAQLTSVAFQSAENIDSELSIPGQRRLDDNRRAYTFSQKSRVARSNDLSSLVLRQGESPQSLIARYLKNENRDPRIADNLVLTKDILSDFGRRHIQLQEQIGGIPLYDSEIKIAIGADNKVLQIIENLPTSFSDQYAQLGVDRNVALGSALEWNFPDRNLMGQMENGEFPINEDSFFYEHPWSQKIMLRRVEGALEEGLRWFAWEREINQLYEIVTDRNGRVVENRSRTAVDSYRVFNPHPQTAAATNAPGPGARNTQSPNGWLSGVQNSISINGNNVHAYLGGGGAGAPIGNGNFLAVADLTQEPDVGATRAASVQSLFYWTNHAHDKLYEFGFREADRNFQQNNFGLGGLGNDAVLAEAQAGRQNNAFFATPVDGRAPKLTMHIYTSPSPDRDSSFDTDIIWHEYGHGLTWRMIGNMGGRTSGAIGEGMSDVLAILMNSDDANAEYTENNADGNRRHRYAGYPKSLRDYNNGVIILRNGQPYYYEHDNGEIYAAAIWRLWEIAQSKALSRDVLLDHLIDGMRFTPKGPDYLDMRDGVLQSTPDYIDCWVWEAFADFGMGEGAVFNPAAIIESNTVPAACRKHPATRATHSTTPEYCPSVKDVQNGKLTPSGNKRFLNFEFTEPGWMEPSKRQATRFQKAVVTFGESANVNASPRDSQAYCYYLTENRNAQNELIVLALASDPVRNVEDSATSLRFVSDPPTGRYYRRHHTEYEYTCRHKHNTCKF